MHLQVKSARLYICFLFPPTEMHHGRCGCCQDICERGMRRVSFWTGSVQWAYNTPLVFFLSLHISSLCFYSCSPVPYTPHQQPFLFSFSFLMIWIKMRIYPYVVCVLMEHGTWWQGWTVMFISYLTLRSNYHVLESVPVLRASWGMQQSAGNAVPNLTGCLPG